MARLGIRSIIALAGLSAFADVSNANQPPCATSDTNLDSTACGSGALALNAGLYNTAMGFEALSKDTSGENNTASGAFALTNDTTGEWNTASGSGALYLNSTGSANTASGMAALATNSTGSHNTASGAYALHANTSGSYNTANGDFALTSNTTGYGNSASGAGALISNTTGYQNAANGYFALNANTTGFWNAALGAGSLPLSTTAYENTAVGTGSLYHDTTGYGNSATGFTALFNATTGIRNTAVGTGAGGSLVSGSYNSYVGFGVGGGGSENYVTRIGVAATDPNVAGTPTTYISGIYNTPLSGNAVVVTSTGQLGVAAVSSERFKTDIAAMGSSTVKLSQLRPVTFKLKGDTRDTVQYGLIAEEVARVYPDLVIRAENGRIDGVRYDELAPMLLNEVQRQAAKIASLEQQLAGLQAAVETLIR